MAWVQQTGTEQNGATTKSTIAVSVTASSASTVGNTLFMVVRLTGSNTINTTFAGSSNGVSDPRGNTWTIDESTTGTGANIVLFRSVQTTATQPGDTITVNTTNNGTYMSADVQEYAGAYTTIDASNSAPHTSSLTTETIATTAAPTLTGDLVLVGLANGQTTTGTITNPPTGGTGWTARGTNTNSAMAELTAASVSGTSPTATWVWTVASASALVIVAYETPGSGVTGSASFSATATLSATGAAAASGVASLSATASLTATGSTASTVTGAASLSATATLTATGAISGTVTGSASLSATATLTASSGAPTPPTPTPSPIYPSTGTRYTPPITYVAYDLLTGSYLGTLPLTQVTFGYQLMQQGTLQGTLDIASPAVQALNPLALTAPARTFIGVDYLGSLIWGGVLWTRSYQYSGTTRRLQIGATDITSYFNQREQATDYSSPPYSGITGTGSPMPIWDAATSADSATWDPVLIAWQVINDALSVPSGNPLGMGIAANGYTSASAYLASGTATPVGDYISQNYPYSSLQQLATMIGQLAANGLGVGFDYAVDVAYSAGPGSPPVATCNFSYPRRGRYYADNGLVLNTGAAVSYTLPEDGTQTGNVIYEQGTSGSLVVSENIDPIEDGYVVLEQLESRSNITSENLLAVLQNLGVADLAIYSYPPATPTVTTDLFNGPIALGDFIAGDDVRWIVPAVDRSGRLFDPRLPYGLDAEWRITGYSAQVADSGQSQLTFNLTLPPAVTAVPPSV